MKKYILFIFFVFVVSTIHSQVVGVDSFKLKTPAILGVNQGITIREGAMGSGIYFIPGTNNEFYMVTDRGPNVEATNRNGGNLTLFFPVANYSPKIFRIKIDGDSLRVISSFTIKRPGSSNVSGIPLPPGQGGTGEIAWSDTSGTVIPPDFWGIDSEGILMGNNGEMWICDEYGPSVWRINGTTGEVIKRYWPFNTDANNQQIDTVFRKRKPNRGFEGVAITPNGKIYAIIQSPLSNPVLSTGDSSRVHRILEIDPLTNQTRMFAYLHQPAIPPNIRERDWKCGELVAINNTDFLVIEQASRNGTFTNKIYRISIAGATQITQELYNGKTLEALKDSAGLAQNGIVPVQKTFYFDPLANGYNPTQDKPEGLAILNDSTFVLTNDNDYSINSPNSDGIIVNINSVTTAYRYRVTGSLKIAGFIPPLTGNTPVSSIAEEYTLTQNYPNPFNPVTNIKFSIPGSSMVKLKIFDAIGREVASLVDNELVKGTYSIDFDASKLSSGVYFYKLVAGEFVSTKKMVLVK